MKEILIIAISLIIVLLGTNFSENYLDKTKNELLNSTSSLKNEIEKAKNNEENNCIEIANKTYDRWKEIEDKWSLIISHEELDSIELALIGMKTSIQENEYEDGLVELEKSNYLIEHIKEREELLLKNIF